MTIQSKVKKAINIGRNDGLMELFNRVYKFLQWYILSDILLFYYRIIDWIRGRRASLTMRNQARYYISPTVEQLPDFEFYFNFNSPHLHRRILGEYEAPVARALANQLDESSQLWEIGAAWGYHSLAVAGIADRVVAFEPDDERRKLHRLSCNVNEFDNISVLADHVESLDNYLDTYGVPDVVLIDIDGWEYDVIPASPELLSTGCTWIVELHHDIEVPPAQGRETSEIEELFRQNGYEVERIQERGSLNWRGKEQEGLNTHHILAQPK